MTFATGRCLKNVSEEASMTSSRLYLLVLIALSMLSLSVPVWTQETGANDKGEGYQAPNYLIESLEGRDLFGAYCAACHGADARGGGPAAASLKTAPPDLTRIAQRRGGAFPLADVERIIAGERGSAETHRQREMPIWGPILSQVQRDQNLGKVRIRNLAKYIESLQAPKPVPASGATR
jgi:mono/diheme cytochrome c family protein